jgi:signal transduction histidine kinase
MTSLRLRLLAAATLGIVVALAITGFIIVSAFDSHVRGRFIKELDDHVLQVAALLQPQADGRAALSGDLSDPQFQRPLSGLYWQVSEKGAVLLRSRSLWDEQIAVADDEIASGARNVRELRGPKAKWLIVVERAVVVPAPEGERRLVVAVACEQCAVNEARKGFVKVVAPSLVILAVLLVLASWAQVRMGLAPLGALRRQLEIFRAGQSETLSGPFPRELSGLVDDLNALMEAQTQAIERARANAGKLAHGLKTPLAVLSTEARALRERGETSAADSLDHEIGMMNAHVARTLAAARAVGPRRPVAVRTLAKPFLTRLVGVMRRLPRGDELSWEVEAAPENLELSVDPRDLEEIAGNLLDNARKWARNRVKISARREGGGIVIAVDDDGPGVPAHSVDDVMARGARLDPDAPGTGIGLGIVSDLAQLHNGHFTIGKSEFGGLRAEIRL